MLNTDKLKDFLRPAFDAIPDGIRDNVMLGGGALRSFFDGTPVKDYDLFFRTHAEWEEACRVLRADPEFHETTQDGEHMFPSFVHGGDLLHFNLIGFRFHETPRQLAASFDFLCVAMACVWDTRGYFAFSSEPGASDDARNRVLRFQKHQTLTRATKRARRYFDDYGYRPHATFHDGLIACSRKAHTPGEPPNY